MPPRKRAASAPKPEPDVELEELETPTEDATEEATEAQPDDAAPPEPAAKAKSARQHVEQPCTDCFPAGWPDDATSAGCGHGTWNRDL